MARKPDAFVFGNKTYIVTGPAKFYGSRSKGALSGIKHEGPIQKVTLLVGLSRGVDAGACSTDPSTYTVKEIVETVLVLREVQLHGSKAVGLTAIPAQGVWKLPRVRQSME